MWIIVAIVVIVIIYASSKSRKGGRSGSSGKYDPAKEYERQTKELYRRLHEASDDQIRYYSYMVSSKYAKNHPRLRSQYKRILRAVKKSAELNRKMEKLDTDGRLIREHLQSKSGRQELYDGEVCRKGYWKMKSMDSGTYTGYKPPASSASYSYQEPTPPSHDEEDYVDWKTINTKREVDRLRRKGFVIEADELEKTLRK